LRDSYKTADSTPITTRQLESMIRLSQARARIELREYVTESDAADVVELMKASLYQTFEDQYGNIDFKRSSGMSNVKQSRRFIAAVKRKSQLKNGDKFTLEVICFVFVFLCPLRLLLIDYLGTAGNL
jgi:DNA helicase MCM8